MWQDTNLSEDLATSIFRVEKKVLCNTGILPHHYRASKPRRRNMNITFFLTYSNEK
jgi:hypothetical protein